MLGILYDKILVHAQKAFISRNAEAKQYFFLFWEPKIIILSNISNKPFVKQNRLSTEKKNYKQPFQHFLNNEVVVTVPLLLALMQPVLTAPLLLAPMQPVLTAPLLLALIQPVLTAPLLLAPMQPVLTARTKLAARSPQQCRTVCSSNRTGY